MMPSFENHESNGGRPEIPRKPQKNATMVTFIAMRRPP